jgi:bis(5'-nucleosyl)-tetraphosphatase (symmetrical)
VLYFGVVVLSFENGNSCCRWSWSSVGENAASPSTSESRRLDMTRQIFIGDVQGCFDELQDLLKVCQVNWNDDEVYLAGDMINRGPKSLEVMQFLMANPQLKCILGNHEHFYLKGKKKKSFARLNKEFGVHDQRIKSWLFKQPYYRESPDWILVHGGLPNGKDQNFDEIDPKILTTIRFDENERPWYENYEGQRRVIFGHWAMRGLVEYKNVIGLDSGCVYGGSLTAFILPDARWLSVPARDQYCQPK